MCVLFLYLELNRLNVNTFFSMCQTVISIAVSSLRLTQLVEETCQVPWKDSHSLWVTVHFSILASTMSFAAPESCSTPAVHHPNKMLSLPLPRVFVFGWRAGPRTSWPSG